MSEALYKGHGAHVAHAFRSQNISQHEADEVVSASESHRCLAQALKSRASRLASRSGVQGVGSPGGRAGVRGGAAWAERVFYYSRADAGVPAAFRYAQHDRLANKEL